MIDFLLTALFFLAFMGPVFTGVSGRLRKRWGVLIELSLIILPPILITLAGMALLSPYKSWTGTFAYSLYDAYFFGLLIFSVIAPIFWYAYHHSSTLKTFGVAFAAAFDPRFAPNQRTRGPVGKIAKSKLLTGTKPPTGSRRFVAWRDRLVRDLSGKGKR